MPLEPALVSLLPITDQSWKCLRVEYFNIFVNLDSVNLYLLEQMKTFALMLWPNPLRKLNIADLVQFSGRNILHKVVFKQMLQVFHARRGNLELSANLFLEIVVFIVVKTFQDSSSLGDDYMKL